MIKCTFKDGIIFIVYNTSSIGHIFYNIKFGIALLRVQDAIQESLGLIEEKYEQISELLTVPLFYDSPQIKQVVEDLRASRDAILYVAEEFANIDDSLDNKLAEEDVE